MSFLFVDTFVMSEGALPEWGTYCEDQAQKLADCFKQELRQFRLNNPQFDNVPTAGFARLFTASFLTHFEEAEAPTQTRESNAAAATSSTVTSPPARQKVWKSIFRKRESKEELSSSTNASASSEGKMRKRSNTMKASVNTSAAVRSPFVEQATVVKSSNMNMLQFNNQSSDNFDNLSWTRCHVSLALTHGMYQLLIRCPPKVCPSLIAPYGLMI